MTREHPTELLDRDHGLDAASDSYPGSVRGVVLAPWVASGGPGPDQSTQLAARTVSALNEVARWAADGQNADPTACAWLAYLRWAVENGARLPEDAPHPPSDGFDREHPTLAAPGEHGGDTFDALSTGALGEVMRPVLPLAASPELLARTAPYGLLPGIGWKPLVALAVDSAAITHGSPEAQTAAVGMALAVHAAVRARASGAELREVVAETARVCGLLTRPAPHTLELLHACTNPGSRRALLDPAEPAPAPERAASTALVRGLAALLEAAAGTDATAQDSGDDVARCASDMLPGDDTVQAAARAVTTTVAAARWGLEAPGESAQAPVALATRSELLTLAETWLSLWRP